MDAIATPPTRDRTFPRRRRARAACVGLLVGTTILLAACAGKKPPPEVLNQCPPNRPGCQIEVVFTDVGLGERVARLDGRLSAQQPDVIYLFTAAAGETLRLKLSGPEINLILTRPDGTSEGPGLPPEIRLPVKGRYVLGVAAHSAAPDAFGEFELELRLAHAP